mgnify:CR=1 FL=1
MLSTATRVWAAYGAAFGVCFPVMAVGIRAAQGGYDGALAAVTGDPLIWIILSAPLFLGGFAALGGRKQDEVTGLNEGLEQTVADRTAELASALDEVEAARADQVALLAALEVGLVSFDRSGALSGARSEALGRVLRGSEKVGDIETLLGRYAGIADSTTRMVRELLWDDSFWSPFDETVAMLPSRFKVGDRSLEASFRPVTGEDGELSRVLVQVSDRTDTARAEAEQQSAKARIDRLSMAARSPAAFERFRRETEGLFDLCGDTAGPEHVRPLHTLKGISRIFAFHQVAADIHAIEDAIQDGERPSLSAVRARFSEQAADVADVLGLREAAKQVVVDRDSFRTLMAQVDCQTAERMRALTARPAADVLAHQAEAAGRLANQKDRCVEVAIHGDDLYEDEAELVDEALTHLLTNAVTHAASPDAVLRVDIGVSRAERLRVEVSDNGAGVDLRRLRSKAVAEGRWTAEQAAHASDNDVLQLIFAKGLSTRDAVGEAAGRGVGLAAARSSLQDKGGSLTVTSVRGQGTTFVLCGPVCVGSEAAA